MLCVLLIIWIAIVWDFVILLGIVYYFYKILFKNQYKNSIRNIACAIIIYISAHNLFLYDKLIEFLPFLSNVNPIYIFIGFTTISVIFLFIIKLILYLLNDNSLLMPTPEENKNNIDKTIIKEDNFVFSRILLVMCFILLVFSPYIILFLYHKISFFNNPIDTKSLIPNLVVILSHFVIYFSLLISVIIVISSAVTFLKYLKNIVYHKTKGEKTDTDLQIPPYILSFLFVCITLFFTYKITNFTMDDLTSFLVKGDYLAVPLSALIFLSIFFILYQISHALILFINKETTESIKKFINKQNKKLKIGKKMIKIIRTIIDIILETSLSTLQFVQFVPSFFSSLSNMVLKDDDDDVEKDDADDNDDEDDEDNDK